MSLLFTPLKLRELNFKNRIFLSPMCQYSSIDGEFSNWHLVHLGSRAVGGVSLVLTEATAVSSEGRISLGDAGLWNQAQAEKLGSVCKFVKDQDVIFGVQLAHAGRKASTLRPWDGDGLVELKDGGWEPLAPSSLKFKESYPLPREMSVEDIEAVIEQFCSSARLALSVGVQVIELHMAHGYLLHEFLSPLSNHRKDEYGGSLEGRMKFPLRVAAQLRKFWPAHLPLFVRISATDWVDGGWSLEDSVQLCHRLKTLGVDFIDCSTGGLVPNAKIPVEPGYQVRFAEAIRQECGIATGAVGLITEPKQAEEILRSGAADAILMARALLRDPYWARRAGEQLNSPYPWPKSYGRA